MSIFSERFLVDTGVTCELPVTVRYGIENISEYTFNHPFRVYELSKKKDWYYQESLDTKPIPYMIDGKLV